MVAQVVLAGTIWQLISKGAPIVIKQAIKKYGMNAVSKVATRNGTVIKKTKDGFKLDKLGKATKNSGVKDKTKIKTDKKVKTKKDTKTTTTTKKTYEKQGPTKPKDIKPAKKPSWYTKDSAFYAGAWKSIPQKVKDAITLNYKYTGKNLPPITRGAVKTGIYSGIGYGGTKAIDMGSKLFQGGNKKTTDISNEVTGGGTTGDKDNTTAQVAGAGGTGINDFVAAHNAALDAGQQIFRFNGKAFSVGKTRMSDF